MKTLIFIFLFCLTLTAQAEKKFDLQPITLPYPLLKLEDIYAYNSTILVRSGDKVYKSSDDGINWKIAFESDKKLRQLYSADAHTIFVVGDSGMAYRTFDYGETWENISFETTENFVAIAAKNYEDYLIISEKDFIYHKNRQDNELVTIKSNSIVPLYSIVYNDSNYVFGGGYYRKEYNNRNNQWIEFLLPYYRFNGKTIESELAEKEDSPIESIGNYKTDSLNFFISNYGIFFNVVNARRAGVTLNNVVDLIFDVPLRGVVINNDRIIFVDNPDNNIYIFSREGYWTTIDTNYFYNKGYDIVKHLNDLEHQHLNITPINSVSKTNTNEYIIASNDSKIYKVKMSEVISGIEDNMNSDIRLLGNKLLLDNDAQLLSIYNYMGVPVAYELISDNVYRLPKGLSFITYIKNEQIKTIKASVIE